MGNYTGPWANHLQSVSDCSGGPPVQRDLALRSDRRQLLQRPAFVCSAPIAASNVVADELWRARCGSAERREAHSHFAWQRPVFGRAEPARRPHLRDRTQGGVARRAATRVVAAVAAAAEAASVAALAADRLAEAAGVAACGGGDQHRSKKYSLNFNVQALNLFNDIDLGTPVGGIQPTFNPTPGQYGPGPQFGRSTAWRAAIFSASSAARRVFFQMAFQF